MNPSSFPLSQDHGAGLGDSLRSLLRAAIQYAGARLRLFWLEGQDVLQRGLVLVGLAIVAVASVLLAYAGLMVALVLWIARVWWEGDVLPAVVVVAVGHLLIATLCAVAMVHATRDANMFHATIKEFKEDQQWLHTTQTSSN